jgi:hypothetical protein
MQLRSPRKEKDSPIMWPLAVSTRGVATGNDMAGMVSMQKTWFSTEDLEKWGSNIGHILVLG